MAFLSLLFSCFLIFATSSLSYLIFPPLIWIALRFSQRTTITAIIVLSTLSSIALSYEHGPFVSDNLSSSIFYLQTFIGVAGLTSLILSIIANEHKRLEKRKDEFISIASHELKTPLTSIGIFLQLLERLSKKEKDKQALTLIEKINKQMKKVHVLINDLRDVSKIEIGNLEIKKRKNYF